MHASLELRAPRVAVLLALLAAVAYANTLKGGFTFDDEPDIRRNPAVTHGVDLAGIFISPLPPGDLYRPLTVLTFAANEALSPANASLFHAVNIVLHAGVTVLVFVLALWLFASVRIATLAGVLFALHPVHTEAVANLVGRAELLAAFLGLTALLTAARADHTTSRRRRILLQSVSVTSFALALLSKESALVVLPLIVLFRMALRGERLWSGLWAELRSLDWVPYVLCALLAGVLRYYVVGVLTADSVTPLDNVLAFVPWTVRVRSALAVLWEYFGLMNVPWVLSADYSYNQIRPVDSWLNPKFLAGAVLVIFAAVAYTRHAQPAVRFAAAFPFVALMLTSNVFFPIGTVKAERLLYLPSIGWVLMVAYAFDRLLDAQRYRRVAAAALVVMVAAFAARTWDRNEDWQDNSTLYASMLRSAPDSAKSHYNFGVALQNGGSDDAAAVHFRRALAIYSSAETALALGIVAENKQRIDEAVGWYHKALEIDPELMEAHTNLCHVLLVSDRFAGAAAACREGLRHRPADSNLLAGLGHSLIGMGEKDKGTRVLRRSLALKGHDEELRTYLAQLETSTASEHDARVVR
jgi:protein O-mannosyl-transferase